MKCFYHPETDAVGICKNCGKGLCMECTADLGNSLACKNRCENEVKSINAYNRSARITYSDTLTHNSMVTIVWYTIVGLSFLAVTIMDGGKSSIGWIVGIAGVFFLFFTFSTSQYTQRIKRYLPQTSKKPGKL